MTNAPHLIIRFLDRAPVRRPLRPSLCAVQSDPDRRVIGCNLKSFRGPLLERDRHSSKPPQTLVCIEAVLGCLAVRVSHG